MEDPPSGENSYPADADEDAFHRRSIRVDLAGLKAPAPPGLHPGFDPPKDESMSKILPWRRLASETVYSCRVFSLRRDSNQSPRTGDAHDFFVLESCDWVNIVPLTSDSRVVLIRQYRHGIGDFTLEVPGGMIDPDDPSPLAAARREMLEETGFDSEDVVELGAIHPNPAIQGNVCHSFLARNVERRATPRFDTTEETETVLVPLGDIPELVRSGRISHALVVVAFYWQDLLAGK
jgi:8-oxo-dGTP pyrophosphatase MutT (NUDIX family)